MGEALPLHSLIQIIHSLHDDVIKQETFFALLALCAGNSPVHGEFTAQRPVTWSFGVFFDLRPNKRWSKQSWGCWLETPSRSLWRHCNVFHCPECTHYFVLLCFVVATSFMVSAISGFACYLYLPIFRVTSHSYGWEIVVMQLIFFALSRYNSRGNHNGVYVFAEPSASTVNVQFYIFFGINYMNINSHKNACFAHLLYVVYKCSRWDHMFTCEL